ncbi:hypothetical protein G6L37_10255 [Agrobacterium rubi]|uniref:hypothetical protein n=1 Tax=Agrobacterium rubi TaxID=28099 RepID=UPI00157258BB|nr:hypothetical protein [Agrobacterium rubi]NTF06544.1 hypothetical protein [Agrobacterium rubi]NTF18786.1 hypothetical protein [Agrobacterium rubi]NTF25749.1 hypothetical protein [Agrobacterium rubi]
MSETEAETVAVPARIPSSLFYERLLLLFAAVLMFAAGSCVYDIISLPMPAPSNTVSFLSALLYSAVFSFPSIVLINALIYFGKMFDPPPTEKRKWDFPGWILKNPYAAIIIGPLVFISPFLFIFGLSGIVFLFAVGIAFYVTPRLLAKGPLGYVMFLAIWLAGGWTVSMLLSNTHRITECVADKTVPLRSGATVLCDAYLSIEKAEGLLIAHGYSSTFVPLKDLAPYEIEAFGPGSWLIRGGIRPYR